MDTNNMSSCSIEFVFDYLEESQTMQLEDEELRKLIQDNIMQMCTVPKAIWFPDDKIDDRIRKYIDDKIKEQPYYKKGIHPSNIVVLLDGEKYHVIPEFYSDEKIQIIIDRIRAQ